MNLAEDFRAFCIAQPTVAAFVGSSAGEARVHQSRAVRGMDELEYPFAVFFRRGTENEDSLDDEVGQLPFRVYFDIECASNDLDESQDLADALRNVLHMYRGPLGTGSVQGIFVEDHDDDYQPRMASEDGATFVSSLQVEIHGYEEG